MVALGLRVEALMLLACVLTGMVVGLFFAPFGWQLQWPNVEMASRGEPSALLYDTIHDVVGCCCGLWLLWVVVGCCGLL